MKIQTINEQRFIPAEVISKLNSYRFDLGADSLTATAVDYDFSKGWTFSLDDGSGEVTYSAAEIRAKLEARTIWKKITKQKLGRSTIPSQIVK